MTFDFVILTLWPPNLKADELREESENVESSIGLSCGHHTNIPETNSAASGTAKPLMFLKTLGGQSLEIVSELYISQIGKTMKTVIPSTISVFWMMESDRKELFTSKN